MKLSETIMFKRLSFLLFVALAALLVTFYACDSPDPTGPAASARINLTATDLSIPADGVSTTMITAYVREPEKGDPAEGPIYWTTTCGSLDKSSDTMTSGVSSITLTAPNYPCTAVVTADAVHAKKSIEIVCYSVDALSVEVSANPADIPADGYSTSTISAVVRDERGLFVPDGTQVHFSTTGGSLSAGTVTTNSGKAEVTLTSETVPKDVTVTATVGSVSGSAHVRFYSTAVGVINLRANPDSGIPADGTSTSILTATVYDVNNNPVEDGTLVYFATTWGSLSATTATTVKGVATVILTGFHVTSYDPVATVTAVSGDKSASIQVYFERVQGTPLPATSTPWPTPTPTPTKQQSTATPTPTPSPPAPTATPTPHPTSTPAPPTSVPRIPHWYVEKR